MDNRFVKIVVIIGMVTFVILLLRDPDRIYLRLALLSMGLVVPQRHQLQRKGRGEHL